MNKELLRTEEFEFAGEFEDEDAGEFFSEENEDESSRRRRLLRRAQSTRRPQRRRSTRPGVRARVRQRFHPWPGRVKPASEYVHWVQSTLNQILDVRLPLDGVMGPATRSALRSFQQREGLPVDGNMGTDTERALLAAHGGQAPTENVSPPAEPEPPDEGTSQSSEPEPPETEYPQFSVEPFTFVGEFEDEAEGEFSSEEEEASRRRSPTRQRSTRRPYRRQSTRPRTGARAWRRSFSWPVRVLPASEYVRWVQSVLNQIMDVRLPLDGVMETQTRSALRRFQEQQGLPVDGIVGPDTERALRAAGEGEPSPVSANEEEAFLGSLWPFGDEAQIEDRTQLTPKAKRVQGKDRAPGKVYALVLHQMAFSRGNDPAKYDSVTAHFAILPDGKIIQLHPIAAYLNASNGFNPGSVAVEFAGNFPNTKGKCWEAKKFGCHKVTQAQIEAGRKLVKHLIKTIGLTHILAHRQSSGTRENDPGPDLWYHVGQWAVDTLGLKDGGPGFWIKNRIQGGEDGKPIPDEWRTWGRGSTTPELEDEFSFTDFPGAVLDVASKGLEGAALQLAVRWGIQDKDKLANLIFFIRHAERNGRKLERGEPDFERLSKEWVDIRDRLVIPLLQAKSGGPTPSSPSTGSKRTRLGQ